MAARELNGRITGIDGVRLGVIVARFNEAITEQLLSGALAAFERHGGAAERCTVVRVPGAYELPLAAKRLAATGTVDAVVCLGCVIRGATAHFDYVAGQAASGISQVMLETDMPVSFGVLTTDTIEQAVERAGTKAGNKGADVVLSALELLDVLGQIDRLSPSS